MQRSNSIVFAVGQIDLVVEATGPLVSGQPSVVSHLLDHVAGAVMVPLYEFGACALNQLVQVADDRQPSSAYAGTTVAEGLGATISITLNATVNDHVPDEVLSELFTPLIEYAAKVATERLQFLATDLTGLSIEEALANIIAPFLID
jgi:hypothetical protein